MSVNLLQKGKLLFGKSCHKFTKQWSPLFCVKKCLQHFSSKRDVTTQVRKVQDPRICLLQNIMNIMKYYYSQKIFLWDLIFYGPNYSSSPKLKSSTFLEPGTLVVYASIILNASTHPKRRIPIYKLRGRSRASQETSQAKTQIFLVLFRISTQNLQAT